MCGLAFFALLAGSSDAFAAVGAREGREKTRRNNLGNLN